ncbi:MAG TPA: prenyltransferase/squalene oxidase repeat-containing protein, partial [Mycobacteriales bacterium]|nr:prenyltransferase/squalene oxidase repeat-containing protein [Mycobacteriales bacterium]
MTATLPPPAAGGDPDQDRTPPGHPGRAAGPFGALGTALPDSPVTPPLLGETIANAVRHLKGLQDPGGWWKGDLETNVTMDAEDLLLRHFLGILEPEDTERAARWIRSQQRADGTWATFAGGPGDLSTTAEAWVALRLAGDPADAPHLVRAAEFVRSRGGVAATRVFTRIWLSLVGLWSWDDVPTIPPEIMLLPPWVPLNIYDWACWARQTIVPLAVVSSLRPVRPVPFGIEELRSHRRPRRSVPTAWELGFGLLDRALHVYGRHPVGLLRRYATRKAERWILDRQEADGSWGGIQPPWVYSLLALHLLGHELDSPEMKAGFAGLDAFMVQVDGAPWAPLPPLPDHPDLAPAAVAVPELVEGPVRWLEACQSPVWDTALALTALLDAGVPA